MHLGDLRNGTPGITSDFGGCVCEAATVCLEQTHSTGVQMLVAGEGYPASPLTVTWTPITDQTRRCYADLQFATEFGAYGIAILLIEEFTDLTVYERSRKGTGFDFWLAPKGSQSPLFQDKRKMEVSGLLDGNESEFRSRVKEKLAQMKNFNVALPGFGVVVHFGRPETRVGVAQP